MRSDFGLPRQSHQALAFLAWRKRFGFIAGIAGLLYQPVLYTGDLIGATCLHVVPLPRAERNNHSVAMTQDLR